MNPMPDDGVLLAAHNVGKHFRRQSLRRRTVIRAVDGVNLEVRRGEILGIAGESGCGKSTLARIICGLTDCSSGTVVFDGKDVRSFKGAGRKEFRRKVQMVFQDPEGSLNPRKTIGQILAQPFQVHHMGSRGEVSGKVMELLERVRLSPPSYYLGKYPHELSGGAKQRVGIARALALQPSLVVADEPVASLDMSIRGAILTLLRAIHREFGVSMILISHDLSVLRVMCSRIAIMYLGKIVETGPTEQIFSKPQHHYTNALLSLKAIPDPVLTQSRTKLPLAGEVPSSSNVPPGCRFHTRCPHRLEVCTSIEPSVVEFEPGRYIACHNPVSHVAEASTEGSEGNRHDVLAKEDTKGSEPVEK